MKKLLVLGLVGICCIGSSNGTQEEEIKRAIELAARTEVGTSVSMNLENRLMRLPACVSDTCAYIRDIVSRKNQLVQAESSLIVDDSLKDDLTFMRAYEQFCNENIVTTYTDVSDYVGETRFAPYSERVTKALLTLLLAFKSERSKNFTLICDAHGIEVLHNLITGDLHQLGGLSKNVRVEIRLDDGRPVREGRLNLFDGCNCNFTYGNDTLGKSDIAFLKKAMSQNRLGNLTFCLDSFRSDEPDAKSTFVTEFAEESFSLSVFPADWSARTQLGERLLSPNPFTELGWNHWQNMMMVNFGQNRSGCDPFVPCNTRFYSEGTSTGIIVTPPTGAIGVSDKQVRFEDEENQLWKLPIEWKKPADAH